MSKSTKKGFGITEVMIAALVMGFMLMAVYSLQAGNRDALLRIRGRDGANEVAREIIDSLSAIGVASLIGHGANNDTLIINKRRTWKGQPGVIQHDINVDYTANVTIAPDDLYQNTEISKYDTTHHVYAKRLDLSVEWRYKNTPFHITVSSIVR